MTRQVRSWAIAALAAFALAGAAAPSFAGITYNGTTETFYLTATGTDFSYSATLQATANGDGSYTVVSGNGAFGSSGLYANTPIALVPNPNAPKSYEQTNGGFGWSWDNQIFPGTSQLLDSSGINFGYTFSSTQYYISSWYDEGYVTMSVYSNPLGFVTGSSALFTPEPSSVSLTSVPEIDPATGGSALSLVAGVLAMIEQRRRRATVVA